jgi:hypothetical protein
MPTISTQTDECVDVIDCLNQEFDVLQDENFQLKLELKETREQAARDYWSQVQEYQSPRRMVDQYRSMVMSQMRGRAIGRKLRLDNRWG